MRRARADLLPLVETPRPNQGWTFDTLFTHFASLLIAVDEKHSDLLAVVDEKYYKLLEAAEAKNNQRFLDQQKAVDAALAAAEKAVKAALDAAQKAVDKAETQEREWRKGSNEWREAMEDREVKFLPRAEYKTGSEGLLDRLTIVERRQIASESSSAGVKAAWGYLVGAVGFLIGLVTLFALLKR